MWANWQVIAIGLVGLLIGFAAGCLAEAPEDCEDE